MTLTSAQTLACGALKIECCLPGQNIQMAALVFLFGKLAGVTDCPTIAAGAAQYSCLSRQEQLPALIFLATQILANLPTIATGPQGPAGANGAAGAPGPVLTFSGNYAGIAPPFTPTLAVGQMAFAYDTSTNTPWYFPFGGAWQN
jgi:hypothetical protein